MSPRHHLGVAMFVGADQDAAPTFSTETLGWELRGGSRFGSGDSMRWLEIAPPGSTARLALNPPMGPPTRSHGWAPEPAVDFAAR